MKPKDKAAATSSRPKNLDNNINLLLELQEKEGYLSRDGMMKICRERNIPGVDINGVATFYAQFRFAKRGKYIISICKGTACHVKGAEKLQDYIREMLGIRLGETTKDGKFTLQAVNCLGACAKAPNIMVNDVVYGELNQKKLKKLLGGLE